MDMEVVNKLKVMSRDQIGQMHVKELSPLDAIWNLVCYIRELESKGSVVEKSAIKVPGLEG